MQTLTTRCLSWTRSALTGLVLAAGLSTATAQTSGLVISQVYGGGGNGGAPFTHDYIEIFNSSNAVRSLNGLSLQYTSASGTGNFGAGASQLSELPNVNLQPGQYYLVQQATNAAVGIALPTPDLIDSTPIAMSATGGKVALVTGTSSLGCNGGSTVCPPSAIARIIDLVGYGAANFFEGNAPTGAPSASLAVFRNTLGCSDTNQNGTDFSVAAPAPRNSASALNLCSGGPIAQPIVPTCPAINGTVGTLASSFLSARDADSRVNAASLAAGTPAGFTLTGFVSAINDGDEALVELRAAASVTAGSYAITVNFTNDDSQTASCAVSVRLSAPVAITRIYTIQGSGAVSPLVGTEVVTEGVVTKRLISQASPVQLRGFFMQDETGDSDASTSDGIFVFLPATERSFDGLLEGQRIRLRGTVTEFNTQTQITSPGDLQVLASGVTVAPTVITFPEINEGDLEAYEGMLVTINTPMTASQNFFQGRFGQVTISANGRLFNPTNVFAPGPQAQALALENARRRIVLDDGASLQNPNPIPYIGADNTLRAGDVTSSVTGVIDFGLVTSDSTTSDYRLHPTVTPVFTRVNARSLTAPATAGNLRVASFNVLNFFSTLNTAGNGCFPSNTAADCRGADSSVEFTRQRDKIVNAMIGLDADIVGLIEIENNGQTAVNNLVGAINARLAVVAPGTSYASVGLPTGGTGTDAIRMGMIYKVGRVTPVGNALSDVAAVHNRPPLAQTFAAPNGERLNVIVNHFKSKRCDGATLLEQDQNDGQSCFNPTRVAQSDALLAFISGLSSSSGTNQVLVLGDLNAYAKEDPIRRLTDNGLVDVLGAADPQAYSFVFNGEAGYLDHALASVSLTSKVRTVTHWKINADEPSVIDYNTEFKTQDLYTSSPFRSSDHDPILVGIELTKDVNGTAGRDVLQGTPGDDVINGGAGADLITTGAGRDRVVYNDMRDAGDQITDFSPGLDQIDLRGLMSALGITAGQAVSQGVLSLVAQGANTLVMIDTDGSAGPAAGRAFIVLRSVLPAQLQLSRDFLF
jgi:uncharacterized protein